MKIGVFDSGVGGEAIASALQNSFVDAEIIVVNDTKNIPYGDKAPAKIIALTDTAIQPLLNSKCDVIVIACNSATLAAIDVLRSTYPAQLFIGIEPMVKSAAQLTKTKVIAVCATPATLSSANYANLLRDYTNGCTIIEPNCADWARMIEENRRNEEEIETTITACLNRGADVIVLGCTHYHWIKEEIEQLAQGRARVLEPSEAIANRVRKLMDGSSTDSLQRQ